MVLLVLLGLVFAPGASAHNSTGILAPQVCEQTLAALTVDWTGKRVVLDSHVLLTDPIAMHKYPQAEVVISMAAIDAVDAVKTDPLLSQASKSFAKELLRLLAGSTDKKRIALANGGFLIIAADHTKDALSLALAQGDRANIVLVTDSFNLRIKADLAGLKAMEPTLDGTEAAHRRRAQFIEAQIPASELQAFTKENRIAKPAHLKVRPNEFVRFSAPGTEGSDLTVGRYVYDRIDPEKSYIKRITGVPAEDIFGVTPRNIEQAMALDVLLDPNIDCKIMEAKAGTGKTLLAVVTAMYLRGRNLIHQTYVSRPPVFVGGFDTGYLPGNVDEKHEQWIQPYLDNLKAFGAIKGKAAGKTKGPTYTESLPSGWEIIPYGTLRGRSLAQALVIIDEIQNTDVKGAKTALTRIAEDSKVIIMGDTTQIDSPSLNANNNGLAAAITLLRSPHFTDDQLSRVGVVHMFEGVRSPFSEMAADGFDRPLPDN